MTVERTDQTLRRRRLTAPAIGVIAALVLILTAVVIPGGSAWKVYVTFPPLHAAWDPRFGPGTIAAILLAIVALRYGIDFAARARWRWLLVGAFLASAAWMISLATVDGLAGIGTILNGKYEYLNTARAVTDFSATLREYVSRIPMDATGHWPVHVAGHPPGALGFFVVLAQLGLGSGLAAGFVVITLGASVPVAILVTLHRLGAESGARAAAPFLVMGSAAIWMAVSADGMFTAFAAWGLCLLALSATATGWRGQALWGIASGLVLGYCVMLSYGLPLLGILAVAILFIARTWRPIGYAVGGALAVVLGFATAGFAWWEAYPVLVERYWAGVATRRPYSYWVWGNLAAFAVSAGPIVGAVVATALARIRGWRTFTSNDRVIGVLVFAGTLTVLLADVSGMSKAEVERIWLPFVPWILLGTAMLPERWRRWGFALQLVFALAVQHLIFTEW